MATDVDDQLKRIDALIRDKVPSVAEGLRPRAKKAPLAKLTALFDGKLPSELAAWFAWHDGETGEAPECLLPGTDWRASSCADIVAEHRMMTSPGGSGPHYSWKPSWIPLFSDGCGDHLCLDRQTGELRAWYHDDPKRPTPHKSLRHLFDRLERAYRRMKKPAGFPPPPPKLRWKDAAVPTPARMPKLPIGTAFVATSTSRRYRILRVKLAADRWLECTGTTIAECVEDWKASSIRPPSASSYRYGTDFSVRFELKEIKKGIKVAESAT